jgi:dehydrogenase/reductase SDR family member 12
MTGSPARRPAASRRPSALADGVDAALEWTIAGSFTRVGSALRRRLERWPALDGVRLDDRVVVITGATSGLGLATARHLAQLGATVELVARDADKAAQVSEQLRRDTGNPDIGVVVADTGDLDAVRGAAAELSRRHAAVHALLHNAGALDATFRRSPQGLEATVASQVVGPSLLTELLRPALRAAAPARVVWVSSGGMYAEPLSVERLEMTERDYDGTIAYARAKRAQIALTQRWARELASEGVVVHAMHPGWADTPGVQRALPRFRRWLRPFLRTAEDGADTLVWLTIDDAPLRSTGELWLDRRPRTLHRLAATRRADTAEERERLWRWVRERGGAAS